MSYHIVMERLFQVTRLELSSSGIREHVRNFRVSKLTGQMFFA